MLYVEKLFAYLDEEFNLYIFQLENFYIVFRIEAPDEHKLFLIAVAMVAALWNCSGGWSRYYSNTSSGPKHDWGQCDHDGWELYR